MDSFTSEVAWLSLVLCAAVGSWFAFHFLVRGTKKVNLPPSPGVIPIVGSFPFLGTRPGEPSHIMFARLAEKLGPLMYLRMGSNPTIVVSSAEVAKEVLKDQDHIFASRPALSFGKYLGMNYRAVSFAPVGSYHKRLRQMYSQEVFSPKRLHSTHLTRENEVFLTLGALYQRHKKGEEDINLTTVVNDLSLNSVLSLLFRWEVGKYKGDKNIGTVKVSELKNLIKDVLKLGGEFKPGDYIAIARWFDLQGVIGRLKKMNQRMAEVAAALIHEYERTGKKSADAPDANVFDVLLSLEGEDKLDAVDLSGITYDLVIGGSDTTGNSSDWTIAELLRQPELIRRLRAELDSVVGKDRFVTEADLRNLPFLQAVVKESLRLHPPAPLGIPHCSTMATKVRGYDIPAGTTTLVNLFAVNRDPNHWPEPLRFNPDRFYGQKKDMSLNGIVYHLLPFSSGRRSCPGMTMGVTMVQLIVGNFLHSFDFQAAGGLPNEKLDVVTEVPSLMSIRAHELLVSVTPRLSPAVYEKYSSK